jgi:hypothetical protein
MPSKGVLDRHRAAKALIASARTHAQQVGERLQTNLAAVVEDGETLPDLTHLQLLVARLLERRLDALVAADESHLEELDDDPDIRRCRDEAATELYDQVVAVRGLVRAALGADGETQVLGLEGPTARDPLTLHRQGERMLRRLREPEATRLTASLLPSAGLDLGGVPVQLEIRLGNLRDAISDVDREVLESSTTQLGKYEAVEAYDEVARGVAELLRGGCRLADFPEFADRIRLTLPSRRRAQPAA